MSDRGHKGRIAFLGQYFPPESGAPETSFDIAKGLTEIGYAVQVITALPNYPTGSIFPGYPKLRPVHEQVRSLPTTRAPLFPSHSSSSQGRIANYLSFAVSSSIVGRRYLSTSDINFIISSPATLDAVGLLYKAVAGRPYVLFVQDLWPDSVFATGFVKNSALRTLAGTALQHYSRATMKRAAAVIAISNPMRDTIIERGVTPERVHTVHNWAQETMFYPRDSNGILRNLLGLSETDFIFLFSGNVGPAQDLEPWVAAFMTHDLPLSAHLVIQGDGERKDVLRAKASGSKHIHFLPRRPLEEAVELEAGADALVVSLAQDPLFQMTIPSKIANCLASGSLVVATVAGEPARVLTESGAALVGEPGRVESVKRLVKCVLDLTPELRREHAIRGRDFYLNHLGRGLGLHSLRNIVDASIAEAKRTDSDPRSDG